MNTGRYSRFGRIHTKVDHIDQCLQNRGDDAAAARVRSGVLDHRGGDDPDSVIDSLQARRVDPILHDCAALDVAATNPRAEALYARLGFRSEVLRQSRLVREDGAVPDHWRMTLRAITTRDVAGKARR